MEGFVNRRKPRSWGSQIWKDGNEGSGDLFQREKRSVPLNKDSPDLSGHQPDNFFNE